MELRERVARAIYQANWREGGTIWENLSEAVREWVRRQADAAITAVGGRAPLPKSHVCVEKA